MTLFNLIAIVITITGLFSYINYKFIKLPTTIGLMAISILFSAFLIFLHLVGFDVQAPASKLIGNLDFSKVLINGLLSFLLFAGSLHINLTDLRKEKWVVVTLALLGTIASTAIVGFLIYFVFRLFGFELPWIYCFLFGALISPTDPIAVLAMLKNAKAPQPLQIKIAGESLFNDGVGIVIFITIMQVITTADFAPTQVLLLFIREAFGGLVLGFILGWFAYFLLNTVKDYYVQVLITLAVVTGGYALALALETSGPIAMVMAGILVGNHGRLKALDEESRKYLDTFWEIIDEVLNSILFVLIGLEVLLLSFTWNNVFVGLIAIAVVLFARFLSVWVPIRCFSFFRGFVDKVVLMLTWGGLRGGLSVAMALSIPPNPYREIILTTTYIVMAFSVLVQGLTMQSVIPKEDTAQ
ncbi:MAG: Na(+)/H(+) antiporter NhaP [Chlamydiae bacterium]|nr:Na(+)/H(+) antiporter NhaP [Chlamydiota bacterium]